MDALLEKLGLPACDDGALVLRRSLAQTKAPRIQINGALATLGALQEMGEAWVDFHGPGEPQKLFQEKHQREMLDAYGKLEKRAWRNSASNTKPGAPVCARRRNFPRAGRMSADEIDFARLQIARIDQLDPTPENLAALERDFNRQSKAQELAVLAAQLESGLVGEEGFAREISAAGARRARIGGTRSAAAAPLAQRLEAAIVELQELGGDFERLGAGFEFDEETARSLQERMSLWLELQRRYGADPAALRAKRDELSRKVGAQSDIEGTLAKLAAESATARKSVAARGRQIAHGPRRSRSKRSKKRRRDCSRHSVSSRPVCKSPSRKRRNCANMATATSKFFSPPTPARRRCP